MRTPTRPALMIAAALFAAGPTASFAETVGYCQVRVGRECKEAQEGAKWWEVVAIGWVCLAKWVACSANELD